MTASVSTEVQVQDQSALPAVKEEQLIRLRNCLMNGGYVNGVFVLLNKVNHEKVGMMYQVLHEDKPTWVALGKQGTVEMVQPGTEIKIESTTGFMNVLSNPVPKMTEEEAEQLIGERFEVMESLIHAMIKSRLNSVIITGAAGIGKTYNVERILEEYERKSGQHWVEIGGRCSATGLYEALWSCRNEGSILVLDDVEVWGDDDSLNILKKALDTTKRRQIDWRTASKALDEKGIPNSFEFKGKVIFLTNVNAYKEISRGTKLAPHLNALISRSVLIDLAIHDVRTIFLHVRSVIRKSDMLVGRGITHEQQEEIIQWIAYHINDFPALSLRTPLMAAEYMLTMPDKWQMMAKHTLLKALPLNW